MLEMTKLVPQILRRFRVELVRPEKEWELEGYWFVKQFGLVCRITEGNISL
jgi:GH43 family beta-xylosidase